MRILTTIDEKDRKPDPAKAAAIKNMPPTNVSTLQAFLRLANYYSNFIPKMHALRDPLNQFCKKDTKWNWFSKCRNAFEKFIKALPIDFFFLMRYNPNTLRLMLVTWD